MACEVRGFENPPAGPSRPTLGLGGEGLRFARPAGPRPGAAQRLGLQPDGTPPRRDLANDPSKRNSEVLGSGFRFVAVRAEPG